MNRRSIIVCLIFKCWLILILSHSGNFASTCMNFTFACFRHHQNSSQMFVVCVCVWQLSGSNRKQHSQKTEFVEVLFLVRSCFLSPILSHTHTSALPSNYRQTIIKEILDWFCFVSFIIIFVRLFGLVLSHSFISVILCKCLYATHHLNPSHTLPFRLKSQHFDRRNIYLSSFFIVICEHVNERTSVRAFCYDVHCTLCTFRMLSCFISVNIFPSAAKYEMPWTSNGDGVSESWARAKYTCHMCILCMYQMFSVVRVRRRRFFNYDLNEWAFHRKWATAHMPVLCCTVHVNFFASGSVLVRVEEESVGWQ